MANSFGKILLLGALVFGCTPSNPPASASTAASTQHYDAKTIFRAVYFDSGPALDLVNSWNLPHRDSVSASQKQLQPAVVAEQLRDLANNYDKAKLPKTAANLRAFANKVEASKVQIPTTVSASQHTASINLAMANIAKQDPTFFDRFGKNIRSGSHTIVAQTLNEGIAHLTSAAMMKTTSTSTSTTGSSTASTKTLKILDGDDDDLGDDDDSSGDDDDSAGDDDDGSDDFSQGDYSGDDDDDSTGDDDDSAGDDDDDDGLGGGNIDDDDDDNANGDDDDNLSGDGSQFNDDPSDQFGGDDDDDDNANGDDDDSTNTNGDDDDNANGDDDDNANGDDDNQTPTQEAGFQVDVHIWYDTYVAVDKVVFHLSGLVTSKTDPNGGIGTASFVDHITDTFAE